MRSHVLIILLIALTVVAQSCCCCAMIGGPQPPYSLTPSDESIQRLQERWATVVEESPDGSFAITVTEEEMTSLVAQMLAKRENLPPVSDLQVHFCDGRIEVYATVTLADSLPVPGLVTFSATATGGEINVTLEEIAFGPLPIPEPVLEELTATLDEMISESIPAETSEVTITDIQIGEGQMTISGKTSPE